MRATSWGVSTRLMGALIMTHSDDKGLVLPPNLAPFQVVIVPIYRNDEQFDAVSEKAESILKDLKALPKDLENNTVELARRDTLTKSVINIDVISKTIKDLLVEIQNDLFTKALDFRNTHVTEVDNFEDFKNVLETKTGFISAFWDGASETEQKIKEITKATIRCIPMNNKKEEGACVYSGKTATQRVLFAKAY